MFHAIRDFGTQLACLNVQSNAPHALQTHAPRHNFHSMSGSLHGIRNGSHCKVLSMQQQSASHIADLPSGLISWLIRRTVFPCMCIERLVLFNGACSSVSKDRRSCSAHMHDARRKLFSFRPTKSIQVLPPNLERCIFTAATIAGARYCLLIAFRSSFAVTLELMP